VFLRVDVTNSTVAGVIANINMQCHIVTSAQYKQLYFYLTCSALSATPHHSPPQQSQWSVVEFALLLFGLYC
jgi:hypothetical protein